MPIGHVGRWLTDSSGRVVLLHGFNMVDKRAPYEPAAVGFDSADAAFLDKQGFNAVRVGVLFEAVEPRPGVFDASYARSIEDTVNLLGRHHILSLLDFHQDAYSERFDGEGFPSWAVKDDGLPLQPQENNWATNEALMPAVWAAYSNFWSNAGGPGGIGLQQRYAQAWSYVARTFASNRNVIGYEIMNEPFPGVGYQGCAPEGCPAFDAQLTNFYRVVDKAIRAVDRKTLVFFEPSVLFDFYAPTHLGPVDKDGAFSFHPYCQGGAPACSSGIDRDFAAALSFATQNSNALLVTEFGATDNLASFAPVLDAADTNLVGWLEWSFWNRDPAPSPPDLTTLVVNLHRPPSGSNVRQANLAALERPYPTAVAGTPTALSYDPGSRAFRLDWSTEKAGGAGRFGAGAVTAVELPPLAYPHGYGTEVTGARILSAPRAAELVLATCPGATTVSVAVSESGPESSTCDA